MMVTMQANDKFAPLDIRRKSAILCCTRIDSSKVQSNLILGGCQKQLLVYEAGFREQDFALLQRRYSGSRGIVLDMPPNKKSLPELTVWQARE